MTYAVNGLIEASDVNGFITTNTPNVNNLWSTGSGNSGYGQTAISTVSVGQIIYENPWKSVVTHIATMASHQGTSIATISPVPATNLLIQYFSALNNNLSLVNTNRLNAVLQGTAPAATTLTNSVEWNQYVTFSFTVNFGSLNSARYYFNAGGQLGLSMNHPVAGPFNDIVQDLCSELGTIWFSSPTSGTATLAGTAYNGITKIGGVASARGVAQTNNGFYAWLASNTLCYTQGTDVTYYYYYYGGSEIRVYAAHNGSGSITITATVDLIPDGLSIHYNTVSAGTTASLVARPPSTTYLTQSWTNPAISGTVTRV
jgi:hypothetical protein